MSQQRPGVRIPLSPARKVVCEMLRHAARVPSVPQSCELQVGALVEARQRCATPPSWVALVAKAFGLVARELPALRRVYIPYWRPHLYEHPYSECAVLVAREWQGELITVAAKVRGPETASLASITQAIQDYATAPIESISAFRQLLRLGRLPAIVRRFAFWQTLYLSGFKRCKRFGTFMISSLGNQGVIQEHQIAPMTICLSFGPIHPDGRCQFTMVYDHRVTDGSTIARAFRKLEIALNGPVLEEMRALPARTAA